jgi:hypothetical protein
MPPSSWQSGKDYASCDALPGNALAREYLARNPQYLKDRKQIDARAKRGVLSDEERAEFATRWGVLVDQPSDGEVRWAASAYPGAMFVVAAMPDTVIGEPLALPFREGAGTYVAGEVSVTLIDPGRADGAAILPSAYSLVLPLDELFDVRLQAAKHLADVLRGRVAKPFPPPISKQRRNRLIAGLRALDAVAAGASYRDIAIALSGKTAVTARPWKTHDLRDRTIRLVRDALKLMRGSYRHLLLHPFRGHLTDPD